MKPDHGKSAHEEHGAPGNDTSQSMPRGDEGMHGDIESMAEDISEVIGATINQTGSFKFRATKVGADIALAQIVQLVAAAQAHPSRQRRFWRTEPLYGSLWQL